MKKFIVLLTNPKFVWNGLYHRYFSRMIPDKLYLRLEFKKKLGYLLNLKNPQTYNEKLQWLKLYDRNPLYTQLCDKYEVRKYISEKIGERYLIPLYGIWDKPSDIDFSLLPNQFVLKCTHDSGSVIICKDKTTINAEKVKKILKKKMRQNYYYPGREWPYKNIKPRIVAEQYMEDCTTQELRDYKFFVFSSEVKALFIATERQKPGEDVKFDFFDSNFKHLPFRQGHENAKEIPDAPKCFEEMKFLAVKLSKGLTQVRIDFYEVNGRVYFGEMTFYHHGGWTPFVPKEWDYIFGEWISLPVKS